MLWIGKFVQWELKQRHSYSLCETEAFYQARRQTSYFSWRPGRQRSRCFNSWVGRGVVLLGILGGVVPPGSLIFPIRFQTRSLKSVPISDLAFRQKWCYHYLDYSANKKTSSNPFRISNSHVSLSVLLIWNWNDNFIHSRSSLKNHTWFQAKMGKVFTRFQTKTVQKPYPADGAAHTYIAYIREYPVLWNRILRYARLYFCLIR